LSKLIEIRE